MCTYIFSTEEYTCSLGEKISVNPLRPLQSQRLCLNWNISIKVRSCLAIFAGQKGPMSNVNRAAMYEAQLTEVTFKSGNFLLVSVAVRVYNPIRNQNGEINHKSHFAHKNSQNNGKCDRTLMHSEKYI